MNKLATELREAAKAVEGAGLVGAVTMISAAFEIERLSGILDDFVAHYPAGLNPSLDRAYAQARKTIAHD